MSSIDNFLKNTKPLDGQNSRCTTCLLPLTYVNSSGFPEGLHDSHDTQPPGERITIVVRPLESLYCVGCRDCAPSVVDAAGGRRLLLSQGIHVASSCFMCCRLREQSRPFSVFQCEGRCMTKQCGCGLGEGQGNFANCCLVSMNALSSIRYKVES